ncbi:50S ribosomal protein L21 [Blattabacterium cuenoti]|nr:50S ribosomal protein L21 [Blattabacterium cuenoti]
MIYAIVNIRGIQFKFIENKYLYIPFNCEMELGTHVMFDQVLFFYKNGVIKIGSPFLEKIKIKVEILKHVRGNKLIIFKKKRRKGYKVKKGFKPKFTKLKVINFLEKK